MDYIEITAAHQGMFDKIMASDNLRVPFSTSGPGASGFLPMSMPVFNHSKGVSSLAMAPVPQTGTGSELARRVLPSFGPSGMPVNGAHIGHLGGVGVGGLAMMHHQNQVESGSSLYGDGMMEKGKRNGREGGRGSRGGGTSGRKRSRGGQMSDSLTTGSVPEGSVSGGGAVQSSGRITSGNGTRQHNNPYGDKAEKSTSRRQSGQGTKRGEKKQTQFIPTPVIDPVPTKTAEVHGVPMGWSSGILDIYGLRTRVPDISRFMVDIPLSNLLSGDLEVPSFSLKESHDRKSEVEDCFEQQISSVFRLLPKLGEARSSKVGETAGNSNAKTLKNHKQLLDLESPIHPEGEEGLSRALKEDKEMWADTLQATKLEACAEKHVKGGCVAEELIDGAGQGSSKLIIDSLPLHPVEDFLSRLKLAPSDSIQSLISQAGLDLESNVLADTRMDSAVVDLCHRNGSIPPLPCSYPPVGPVKAENGRWNQRIWIRGPMAENMSGKVGSGSSGKEVPISAEDDAGSKSPDSRWRKVESKMNGSTLDAMEISTSGVPESECTERTGAALSTTPEATLAVKEEPRQVENAVVLSSEGTANPMEVDSGRVENGAVAISVTERSETLHGTQASITECDQQRSNGEAVRPLETPATLAGPQEMDSSDRLSKPIAEVKHEAAEQDTKEPAEILGESKLEAPVLKQEISLDLPSVDLKVSCRSPSPPANETSSSFSAMPSSPGVQAAARLLCTMANSVHYPDQERNDGERDKRRRFQPYQGAPAQKSSKTLRLVNSPLRTGDGGREARTSADGGSVPPSKALVSERRKSLSQVNDSTEKPSISPRNSSGGGVSTISRGISHTAARTSHLSVKTEKSAARESTKDSTSTKDLGGRNSLPPLSTGGAPSKSTHKGVKHNGYLHSNNPKGSVATASFAKVTAAACSTQRVVSGGSARSSRPAHPNSSMTSHGSAPVSVKSLRPNLPDSRQKSKTDSSVRGAKSSRD